MTKIVDTDDVAVDLTIPVETVCGLIMQAREISEEDLMVDPDEPEPIATSEEPEDMEPTPGDPIKAEMEGLIRRLSIDEQIDLVALTWLARDSHTADEWASVRADAAEAHNAHTAEYLGGEPMLADYLTEGLALLGYSCDDFERKHL